jgi:anti-anti-sigma factor
MRPEHFRIIRVMVDGGREVCLRLFGDLDADARDELRHELYDAVHDNRAPLLVVDLHDTAFLGSAAIGSLLEGFLLARRAGKTPRIINAHGAVRTVLQVTGVLELFGAAASGSLRQAS